MVAIGALLAALSIPVSLAGCGQKGPLYHPDRSPDPKPGQQQPAPTPATAPSSAR